MSGLGLPYEGVPTQVVRGVNYYWNVSGLGLPYEVVPTQVVRGVNYYWNVSGLGLPYEVVPTQVIRGVNYYWNEFLNRCGDSQQGCSICMEPLLILCTIFKIEVQCSRQVCPVVRMALLPGQWSQRWAYTPDFRLSTLFSPEFLWSPWFPPGMAAVNSFVLCSI